MAPCWRPRLALAFAIAGHVLWNRPGLRTPGGLLIAVAVAMVPLIVYGLQDWLQLWAYAQAQSRHYNAVYPSGERPLALAGNWRRCVGIVVEARYRTFPSS